MKGPEDDLLNQVLDACRIFHWRAAHFRPALTKHGWRTPVQADGKGFPDLVLVRPPRIIFAELKSDTGKLSVEQKVWLDALGACTFSTAVHVWRPKDFDDIIRTLK